MLKILDTISSEVKSKNPYWEYKLDRYKMPDEKIGEYHYVNSQGSTFIIPKKEKNTFVLTRQYRYLNKRFSIEFPGGGLKPEISPIENARSELREEAGYLAGDLIKIGEYNPYNGVTNEICTVFLATSLEPCNSEPEASEEFEILELTTTDIINKIIRGEIWDGMTLAAWSLYYFSPFNGDIRI